MDEILCPEDDQWWVDREMMFSPPFQPPTMEDSYVRIISSYMEEVPSYIGISPPIILFLNFSVIVYLDNYIDLLNKNKHSRSMVLS